MAADVRGGQGRACSGESETSSRDRVPPQAHRKGILIVSFKGLIQASMASAPLEPSSGPAAQLEPTSPEVKRYQHQKLMAQLCSMVLSLAFVTLMALWGGPKLDEWLRPWLGE